MKQPSPLPPPRRRPAAIAISPEQIAKRAYELWLGQGCPSGHETENWLEAERELQAQSRARELVAVDLDEEGLAAKVERRLDEITEQPAPRSPTSLEP